MKIEIEVPAECPEWPITLYYVQKGIGTGMSIFDYLQTVRHLDDEDLTAKNRKTLEAIVKPQFETYGNTGTRNLLIHRLATELESAGQFDAILCPQSRRPQFQGFALEATAKYHECKNLTGRFKKASDIQAGTDGTSYEMLENILEYTPGDDEKCLKRILILDDLVASGKTIAAYCSKLSDNGVPADCEFVVVAPLWLPD
jgi:adenine/guanine phosphoribosyltransferase-like PRPP-binding protein